MKDFSPSAVESGKNGRYDGRVYNPKFDDKRLDKQLGRVYACMIDGAWRTLDEINSATGDPQASISAQLRHLRKPRFGAYILNRRIRGQRENGLYEYQLLESLPVDSNGQMRFA